MKKNCKEYIWKKFKMLTVIDFHDRLKWHSRFLCQCECWKQKIIRWSDLSKTKSCWCWIKTQEYKNLVSQNSTKHWMEWTRFYNIWRGLKKRCNDKKEGGYYSKWITYSKSWEVFLNFKEDMYAGYILHCKDFWEKKTSIDRIENNWDYCKENCRWATHKQQTANRHNTPIYKWITLSEYCQNNDINYVTIISRIKRWMEIERALTKPIIKRKSMVYLFYNWLPLKEYCNKKNINYSTIITRVRRWMKIEEALKKIIKKRLWKNIK